MTAAIEAMRGALAEWLPRQRWFGAKGREITSVRPVGSVTLVDGEPRGEHVLIAVEFADGGPVQHYQLLLGLRRELPPELEHVSIGAADGLTGYDGLWDPELTRPLLDMLADGAQVGPLHFVPEPDAVLPRELPGRVLGAEQSNTSVAYGEQAILKVFRRVTPGVNPDLELHRALRGVGCTHVAELLAGLEGELAGQPTSLGMLQVYAANSAEGWTMALVSVRDLLAEADLRADEVGGDFAGESCRLGEAVAAVHADLATALGTSTVYRGGLATMAKGMLGRLDAAMRVAPELEGVAPALRAAYAAVADLAPGLRVQRVHGDLHLGQLLRTPKGWLLIDFEGEPARPLAQRRELDFPLRDVAGMLRSFDYAAYHQLAGWERNATGPDNQLQHRAEEWTNRNRNAFCDGYAAASGTDPRDSATLLRALELDKAVYESVYETRNRPLWAEIPLRSLRRLVRTFLERT